MMMEPIGAQEKLDRIVVLIAANMIAEVCSIYVARGDGVLELYATEGLNRSAVHLTTIREDEGLVGLIATKAEPLALSDAQNHPAFSYKPETGEEIYQSFLGVPVLRGGNTLGVLVVQNRAQRLYVEEEIEALETTAMVLAETIASGELQASAQAGTTIASRRPMHQKGLSLVEGIGLGHVVLHEPRVVIGNIIADNVQAELERLEAAITRLRTSIDELIERGEVAHNGEHREVLETFRLFAHDPGWMKRMREAVLSGLTAEGAVDKVQSDNRARLMRQTDPYLRERLHDLDELANRLLHVLVGRDLIQERAQLPDNAILVARSMGPAALLDYDRSRLRGLVLEEGGASSHIAIVARALNLPAVSEIENATGLVEQGDAIIVDGVAGEVQVRPASDVEKAYADKAKMRAKRQEQYRALRHIPSRTLDGIVIDLQLNAGLLVDLPHISETGAQGVGLFRTELQFMVTERMPSTSEQETLYAKVLETAGKLPVTFRTLDIGGDKILPYMQAVEEENPALGWRAIRIGLDRPALLRAQVRALLKAAKARDLKIMFPMVATLEEFTRAKSVVAREHSHLARHNHELPRSIALGVMIEVPSMLFELDAIARDADFLSVGSNDLMQFFFAADRENRFVAGRFDTLSPSALRALRLIAQKADDASCPVTVCGEMAARPLDAMALIGLGFRRLSMSPAAIGPVKAMLLGLHASRIKAFLDEELARPSSAASLRPKLTAFARSEGVAL
jgi:phosphotransferase system, enzyme I, PtsP